MSNISKWSSTASSNNAAPPDGAPEGMSPASVNDSMREMMAATRRYYEAPEFRDWGHVPTYTTTTTFTIPTDVTAIYHANRRIQATVTAGTVTGTVKSSSYTSPNTTITVVLDSGSLDSGLSAVALGAVANIQHVHANAIAATRPDGSTGNITDSMFTTGDVKLTLKTVADAGWIIANDGTIGSASSGATTRANADCQSLYTLLWNNIADTYAPVTGGRGASASADWSANKPIALTKMLGRSLAAAGTGNASDASAHALGSTAGTETVTLTQNQMPSHAHSASDSGHTHQQSPNTYNDLGTKGSNTGTNSINTSYTSRLMTTQSFDGVAAPNTNSGNANITIGSTGGGAAHPNMQPTSFLNVMIKL